MIRQFILWSVAFCALWFVVGCTSDFDETNVDPNSLKEVSPSALLNPLLYGVANHNMYRSWSHNNHLMQCIVPFPSNVPGLQRYDLDPNIGASSWDTYYRWMMNAEDMVERSQLRDEGNYQAIALTFRALLAANLTDIFGDIPYFEALKGKEGRLYPAFDSQSEIYKSIFDDLELANQLYDEKWRSPYVEDLLYGNDFLKWRKFTNSLHLRLLLRVSNRIETGAYEKMVEMLSNPIAYPIFEGIEDQAVLQITGVAPNLSPWSRIQDFTLSRKMASFFIEHLNQMDDPRREVFATEAYVVVEENGKKIQKKIGYKGIPSGFDGSESQFDYEASTLNKAMAEVPVQAPIMTYAEILFIQAELAQKGYWKTEQAEEWYNKGVAAAMHTYGLELPERYFENEFAKYDGSLERILLQKYYALYMNDYQQWFEYKRTGYPILPKTQSMLNNGLMPSRFHYPLGVRTKNKTNYEKQIQKMGGDNINYPMWWQS